MNNFLKQLGTAKTAQTEVKRAFLAYLLHGDGVCEPSSVAHWFVLGGVWHRRVGYIRLWLHRRCFVVFVLKVTSAKEDEGSEAWATIATALSTSLRKSNQNPVTSQRAFKKPFNCSLWHSHIKPTRSSSVSRPPCFLRIVTNPVQRTTYYLSGYPESFCSDCPWMVPVASCGVMAASLWDKQPLRKGRTITNQCVQLPDGTQRSCAEAASHFSPKAFWRKWSSLRGWVNGCLLMYRLWLKALTMSDRAYKQG